MKNILIAEDNITLQTVLKDLMLNEGYEVSMANDGAEALKVVASKKIDLIILDIIMPNKEGLETLRELKKRQVDIKVIAITGKSGADPYDYLFAAKAFGAEQTLKKPFSNDEILSLVHSVLS